MEKSLRNKSCCFTGHRKMPLEQCASIAKRLEEIIKDMINNGMEIFWCGGALGFDTMAAQEVIKLRKEYTHIKLFLALPCLSQTRGWKAEDIAIYEKIKAGADKVVYTSKDYTSDCMHKRNRHLINNSSLCICYLTENTGGTVYTVNYAYENGLSIINLGKNRFQSFR